MDKDELVRKMRDRMAQCRRLARGTIDERTAKALSEMADEAEADLKRLEAS